MPALKTLFADRLQVNAVLVVACFVAVLTLGSQSAASYPTYLLALAVVLSVSRWKDVLRVRLFWAIGALVAYLTLTSMWSDPFVPRDALSVLARALLVLAFVVAFAECQVGGERHVWLGRALALSGSLVTLAAIVVFVVTDPADGRLNGLGQLDTHIIAALVFGVVLVFVLERLFRERRWQWRALAVVGGALIVSAVYLSDSRNAWVSVTLGVSVFVLAHRVSSARGFVTGLVAVGIIMALVLGALIANETTREHLLPRGDSYRPAIWLGAFTATVEENVWFGRGILTEDAVTVPGACAFDKPRSFGRGIRNRNVAVEGVCEFKHPHNLYLSVFHQGGVVAVLLMASVIVGVLRTLLRHFADPAAKLALGVLGIALPAYLLDGHELIDKVGSTWFLFWLPVALALGLAWGALRRNV